jgi:hypothetical protein
MSALAVLFLLCGGGNECPASETKEPFTTIMIIEHPGYMETLGDVYNIEPGEYNFVVANKSGKDGGFVLEREGEKPKVIMIEHDHTGILRAVLRSGSYRYYCPMIPTPFYPVKVK